MRRREKGGRWVGRRIDGLLANALSFNSLPPYEYYCQCHDFKKGIGNLVQLKSCVVAY